MHAQPRIHTGRRESREEKISEELKPNSWGETPRPAGFTENARRAGVPRAHAALRVMGYTWSDGVYMVFKYELKA